VEANEFVGFTLPVVNEGPWSYFSNGAISDDSGDDGDMPDFSEQVLIGQYTSTNNPDKCRLGHSMSSLEYNGVQLYNADNFVINTYSSQTVYSVPKNCTVINDNTGNILDGTIKFFKLTLASDVTLPIDLNDVYQVEVTDAEEIEVEFDYDAETTTLSYTIPDIDSTHEMLGIEYQVDD